MTHDYGQRFSVITYVTSLEVISVKINRDTDQSVVDRLRKARSDSDVKTKKLYRWSLFVSFIWLGFWALQLYVCWEETLLLGFNGWGDFFAGISAPLAFFWLVLGYKQQGEELRQNFDASIQQAEELGCAAKQQTILAGITTRQTLLPEINSLIEDYNKCLLLLIQLNGKLQPAYITYWHAQNGASLLNRHKDCSSTISGELGIDIQEIWSSLTASRYIFTEYFQTALQNLDVAAKKASDDFRKNVGEDKGRRISMGSVPIIESAKTGLDNVKDELEALYATASAQITEQIISHTKERDMITQEIRNAMRRVPDDK